MTSGDYGPEDTFQGVGAWRGEAISLIKTVRSGGRESSLIRKGLWEPRDGDTINHSGAIRADAEAALVAATPTPLHIPMLEISFPTVHKMQKAKIIALEGDISG